MHCTGDDILEQEPIERPEATETFKLTHGTNIKNTVFVTPAPLLFDRHNMRRRRRQLGIKLRHQRAV